MKKFILFFVFLGFLYSALAQRVYFVYLQSENDQPFFIKLGDKFHSSSSSGYLILSNLRDSIYDLAIGFPKNKWPEQAFTIAISNKDHGFLLKNFGEKGWGLFDVQTMAVQMSSTKTPMQKQTAVTTGNKDVSVFTDMLSKASDDPSLKEEQILPRQLEVKNEPVAKEQLHAEEIIREETKATAASESKDEKLLVNNPKTSDSLQKEPVEITSSSKTTAEESNQSLSATEKEIPVQQAPEEPYQKTVIHKRSESSTTGGFGLVFIDEYASGKKDTVSIFIPNPNIFIAAKKDATDEGKKFLDISTKAPSEKDENEKSNAASIEKASMPGITKDKCPAIAEEHDFFQLRKNMAAVEGYESMIEQAKKYFIVKCFTTEQVKNLSALFLKDEGKYRFFDAAYSHVSDAGNYGTLASELKDEYFINRFKAMLRN